MNEQQAGHFCNFFNRMPGEWWLCGEMLIYWVTHRKLKFGKGHGISVTCTASQLKEYCNGRGVVIDVLNKDYCILIIDGNYMGVVCHQTLTENIVANEQEKERLKRRRDLGNNGIWQCHIDPIYPNKVQIPFKLGTILDEEKPLWWKDNNHAEYNSIGLPIWFTPERKACGYELLQAMFDCGERTGIRDAMWLSFGNLLGYVTTGDFLKHDNDLDVCINTEMVTPEKCNKYIEEIKKPMTINGKYYPHGLAEKMFRHANKRDDNNCPLWVSIGHRSVQNDNGAKSCNWFMFDHSGHSWHSKGGMWTQPGKFNEIQYSRQDKAICLGIPSDLISQFTDINFNGVAVQAPTNAGSVLDYFYPGFCSLGQKGTSMRRRVMVVPNWHHKKTWKMI